MRPGDIKSIHFSEEASVFLEDGSLFNAFQMNSYIARVEFSIGHPVIIAFPRGARQFGVAKYMEQVVRKAQALYSDPYSRNIAQIDP